MRDFLESLGINIALVLAGILGALVSSGSKKKLNFLERIISWISGGAIANYLTPVVLGFVNISDSSQYGFAFLLGFSGLEGVKWLIINVKTKYSKKEDL